MYNLQKEFSNQHRMFATRSNSICIAEQYSAQIHCVARIPIDYDKTINVGVLSNGKIICTVVFECFEFEALLACKSRLLELLQDEHARTLMDYDFVPKRFQTLVLNGALLDIKNTMKQIYKYYDSFAGDWLQANLFLFEKVGHEFILAHGI